LIGAGQMEDIGDVPLFYRQILIIMVGEPILQEAS
jgi:hypothetical protein